jgi:hypothetical protein
MMAIFFIIGVITIFGVLIVSAVETKRIKRGQPDIITSLIEKKADKSSKQGA